MSTSIQSSRQTEPPWNSLAWALVVSILIHALAAHSIKGVAPMPWETRITRVDVTLRTLPNLEAIQPSAPVNAAGANDRSRVTITKRVEQRAVKKDAVVAVPDGTAASHKIAETGATIAIDMETIRDQISNMDPDWTATTTRGAPAGSTALFEERPILGGLANALGERPSMPQETVQNDGSRLIRFSGGRCLHVPAHVPYWKLGGPFPVEWVVTNCAD
jgi:hypothetical protein